MQLLSTLIASSLIFFSSAALAQPKEIEYGPNFSSIISVARLAVDCRRSRRQPCIVPLNSIQELEKETRVSRWTIVNGESFVTGYRHALTRYLIEQRARVSIDPDLSSSDLLKAELALNRLDPYWGCLEQDLRSAKTEALATRKTLEEAGESASHRCANLRVQAMSRISQTVPDFAYFDPVRDGRAPEAGVAEVLNNIQKFVVAYNAGLRGTKPIRHIEFINLPSPLLDKP